MHIIGIMEHIEPCGIHSETHMLCYQLSILDNVRNQIIEITKKIAIALEDSGIN